MEAGIFLPVDICSEPPVNVLPSVLEPAINGRLKIELSGGHRLTVEGDFDGDALACLLKGQVS